MKDCMHFSQSYHHLESPVLFMHFKITTTNVWLLDEVYLQQDTHCTFVFPETNIVMVVGQPLGRLVNSLDWIDGGLE